MAISLRPEITKALQLIAMENSRIADVYTAAEDDGYPEGDLAEAAAVYAILSSQPVGARALARPNAGWKNHKVIADHWPFENPPKIGEDDTNESRLRDLVKAGNLIISEIARRIRKG